MSVKTSMTALADQVRRLSGETAELGIDAMTTALEGVTAGGSGGVDLANVEAYIADFADGTSYTVTEGAMYGTKRAVVSLL